MKFLNQKLFRTALSAGLVTTATMVSCGGDDGTAINTGAGKGSGGTPVVGDGDGDVVGDGDGDVVGGDGDGDVLGDGDGDILGDGDGDGLGGAGGAPPVVEEPVVVPDNLCQSDKDCRDLDGVCAMDRNVCVNCLSEADCGEGDLCQQNSCVTVTACESSKVCGLDEVCSDGLGYCVECEGNNDCAEGSICSGNTCKSSCSSDKDCRENDQVCNMGASVCNDCVSDADCGESEYCGAANECESVACSSGDSFCSEGEVLTCSERGAGYSSTTCDSGCDDSGSGCADEGCVPGEEDCGCATDNSCDAALSCVNDLCIVEEVIDNCANTNANYCNQIPAFNGTQVMDGIGDEFCNIPGVRLNFANAEFTDVINESADTAGVEATLRMAWDQNALRAHVHVKDPNVQHSGGDWFNGDNVQFFFSPAAPVMGDLSNNDAVQFAILPVDNGRYTNINGPGGTLETASRIVSDGYEVEMSWTWDDTLTPFEANDTIGFDIQIGVQNDDSDRDYQFAYALKRPGDTNCGGNPEPWCDASHWCSPRLAN